MLQRTYRTILSNLKHKCDDKSAEQCSHLAYECQRCVAVYFHCLAQYAADGNTGLDAYQKLIRRRCTETNGVELNREQKLNVCSLEYFRLFIFMSIQRSFFVAFHNKHTRIQRAYLISSFYSVAICDSIESMLMPILLLFSVSSVVHALCRL